MGQALKLGRIVDKGQVIYYVCDPIQGGVIASDSSIEQIAKRFEIIPEGEQVEFINEPNTVQHSARQSRHRRQQNFQIENAKTI